MTVSHVDRARVLVVHDFAESFGGAERVTQAILDAFPRSELFAIAGRPSILRLIARGRPVDTRLPARRRFLDHYRLAAPIYPVVVERWRLPPADLIVSSSYAYAHGARSATSGTPHLCYAHSPLRHVWSTAHDYRTGVVSGQAFHAYRAFARRFDRRFSTRVDRYLTQSPYTRSQLLDAYGIHAHILPPPVDLTQFSPRADGSCGEAFLFAGRLVEPYKRPGLVVEAFRKLPHLKLRIAGDGPARRALEASAPGNVEFLGHMDTAQIAREMRDAKAIIFPSVDDYGLIPVEAAASGRPVIAFRQGGACHTVLEGITGVFFDDPSVPALIDAVERLNAAAWSAPAIREHANQWHPDEFRNAIRSHAQELLDEYALDARTSAVPSSTTESAPDARTDVATPSVGFPAARGGRRLER